MRDVGWELRPRPSQRCHREEEHPHAQRHLGVGLRHSQRLRLLPGALRLLQVPHRHGRDRTLPHFLCSILRANDSPVKYQKGAFYFFLHYAEVLSLSFIIGRMQF